MDLAIFAADAYTLKIQRRRFGALDGHDSMNKYREQFESMDRCGMNIHSEDESDDEYEEDEMDEDRRLLDVPEVKITSCMLPRWRSRSLTILLWHLDELARQKVVNDVNDNDRIRKGNAFRRRKLVLEFGPSRRIPSRLPINWYSRSFIRGLEAWEVSLLAPGPPVPIEGIELVLPYTEDEDISMEGLKEVLSKMKDAEAEDLDRNSMNCDEE